MSVIVRALGARGRSGAGAGRASAILAAIGFAILGVAPEVAADGIREIDQTCAITTGCFSGDAPGLPVTIDGSAGRSYRLTTTIANPVAATPSSIIQIQADDVTLDLNGFDVGGCGPTSCIAAVVGIDGTGTGIVVRNGRVRLGVQYGIRIVGGQSVVERIVFPDVLLGTRLVEVGPASLVSGVQGSGWSQDPLDAISVGAGSIVERSALNGLGSVVPYHLEAGSLLVESRLIYRSLGSAPAVGPGVEAVQDVRIARSTLFDESAGPAISVPTGASIAQNLVRGNLVAGSRSHVQGNLIDTPTAGVSLELGQRSTYRENVVTAAGSPTPVVGTLFLNMGANACNGAIAACP